MCKSQDNKNHSYAQKNITPSAALTGKPTATHAWQETPKSLTKEPVTPDISVQRKRNKLKSARWNMHPSADQIIPRTAMAAEHALQVSSTGYKASVKEKQSLGGS